ncbi:MAG TPA: hypothetical protein VFM08_03765 [Nocardioides sp.]|nr:hypothetical protein [Nocardioides sp.]
MPGWRATTRTSSSSATGSPWDLCCGIGVRRGARISRGLPTDIVLMDAVPADFGPSVLR